MCISTRAVHIGRPLDVSMAFYTRLDTRHGRRTVTTMIGIGSFVRLSGKHMTMVLIELQLRYEA